MWILLMPLTLPVLERFLTLPSKRFPTLIFQQEMWVLAAVLVPVGLSVRPFLRPVARGIFKTELILLLIPLWLMPVGWLITTSFKESGEHLENPHRVLPLPRLVIRHDAEWKPMLPQALQDMPDPLLALQAWDEITRLLTQSSLESAFTGKQNPLPPDDMIRALSLFDFIQQDRHGYFVPESTFTRSVPPEMDPDASAWIERLRRHIAITPERLATELSISTGESLRLLRLFERSGFVRRIPGGDNRFRPSASSRHPSESGWRPHQILLPALTRTSGVYLSRQDYGQDRGFSRQRAAREIHSMLNAGLLEEVPGWKPDAYMKILDQPGRLREAGLQLGAILLGLLAGLKIPGSQRSRIRNLILLAGSAALYPWPGSALVWVPLRLGLGLWLFRMFGAETSTGIRRVSALGALTACTALAASLVQEVPRPDEVEFLAAWHLVWLVPLSGLLATVLNGKSDRESG
jgi:hypothetical protein